jgi:ubiquinone/menaquinone biosynthesis C-methylase UbiE
LRAKGRSGSLKAELQTVVASGAGRFRRLLALALWLFAASANAQTGRDPSFRYEVRSESHPDGIGKIYCGREIARAMSHEGADWLERPERNAEEHTEQLLELLRLKPGEHVADFGAGSGYFTRRLAQRVGPTGRVYAVDIQEAMLALLTNRLAQTQLTNVQAVLGTPADPRLPTHSLDRVLMVDVYHECEHPFETIEALCRSLKRGGQLALVEYRGEDPNVPIKPLHKMTEAQVRREMTPHPLDWEATLRDLPRQHVILFRRR